MESKIFCGQCGTKNPKENNYCFKCGFNLIHEPDSLNVTEVISSNISDYNDIKEALQCLINTNGWLVITIGDYYVQFSNNLDEQQLDFEAESSEFLPSIGNKDKEFKQLSFTRNEIGNYNKIISHNECSFDQIVQEIKFIFESIYKIRFTSYNIESDFENAPTYQTAQTTATTNFKKNNRKYVYIVLIVIAVIIGFYALITRNSGNSSTYNNDLVKNSSYDGSVYQVEDYLKDEYLKDPDSYQGIEWSKVQKDNSNSLYKYYVRHKYRAKNGFGGYAVEEKIFYLDQSGNVVSVTDL